MRHWTLITASALGALTLAACQPAAEPARDGAAAPNPTQTPPAPAQKPAYRFKIGGLEAVALFDGTNPVANDNQTFGVGLTPTQVGDALAAAGQPTDPITLDIHPLLVRAGARVMLFDTGLGAGKGQLMQSLAAAGVDPASITDVFISHAHPDHVGGLTANGALAFPNAAIRLSQAEWASMRANPELKALVGAITPKVQTFAPGDEPAPGVKAQDTSGHTPGHVSYLIADGQNQLLYVGDVMHHWLLSPEHPEWRNGYDGDQSAGAERRVEQVERLASTGARLYAYHFPYPGLGRLQARQGRAVFVAETAAAD